MIPLEKFEEILEKLLERSRKGEVEWFRDRAASNRFSVALPSSRLTIENVSPQIEADYYSLQLSNSDGVEILRLVAREYETENPWLNLLASLYSEAFRCVTGWDKVLADLEQAVDSKNPVGTQF